MSQERGKIDKATSAGKWRNLAKKGARKYRRVLDKYAARGEEVPARVTRGWAD